MGTINVREKSSIKQSLSPFESLAISKQRFLETRSGKSTFEWRSKEGFHFR